MQHVDDVLICSTSTMACEQDTIVLLTASADKGQKVSKDKLQFCKEEVKYLGPILKGDMRLLSPERVTAMWTFPKPTAIKQVKSFLGAAGYCQQWIIDSRSFALLAHPLLDISLINRPDPWNGCLKRKKHSLH